VLLLSEITTLLTEHHHLLTRLGEVVAWSEPAASVAGGSRVISALSPRPGPNDSRCGPAARPRTGPTSSAVATCTAPSPRTESSDGPALHGCGSAPAGSPGCSGRP